MPKESRIRPGGSPRRVLVAFAALLACGAASGCVQQAKDLFSGESQWAAARPAQPLSQPSAPQPSGPGHLDQSERSALELLSATLYKPAPEGGQYPQQGQQPQAGRQQASMTPDVMNININGLTLHDAVGLAIARHPDISRAQAVVAQTESQVAVARAAWYPTLEYGVNPAYNNDNKDGNEISGSLGVRQLVYDFGRTKSKVSAVDSALKQQRYLLQETVENVAYSTAINFVELAASQETIAAAERQVQSLRQTKKKIEQRVKAGLSDISDLNQAEVSIQRAAAEALTARTEFDVAAGKLAQVAGIRPYRVQKLATTSAFISRLSGGAQDSIENTPSVQAAEAAVQSAAARVNLARAERFPSIGVRAGQGISNQKNAQGTYGADGRSTWVGLSLNGDFSLGGLNSHQITAAEAEHRAESQALANQRLLTRTALGSAETEASGANARLSSYQSVIDLSRKMVDLYWQQYTLNKRPLTEVINAERDVYQSEVSRIVAIADRDKARVRASAAIGTLVPQLKAQMSHSQ